MLAAVFLALFIFNGVWFRAAAFCVFLTASITDYFDGRIARERGLITHFGQLMDPIADKLLTISAFVVFVQLGVIPAWMAVIVIMRDVLITGLRLAMPSGESQSAGTAGKQKTALQFCFIVAVLAFLTAVQTPAWDPRWTEEALSVIRVAMLFIVALTVWSALEYFQKNKTLFG